MTTSPGGDAVDLRLGVDWLSEDLSRRIRAGRGQPLARACWLSRDAHPRILDATAGYGRDGIVLAALGAQVTLSERITELAQALLDEHARVRDMAAPEWLDRVHIHAGDTRALLTDDVSPFDVIYIDPMYAPPGQRARAKAPLQALRERTGGDADAAALAALAWQHTQRRIVVKRAPKAPALLDRKPSYVLRSNRVRFDIYVKR